MLRFQQHRLLYKSPDYGSRYWDGEKDADMRLIFQAIDDKDADAVDYYAKLGLGKKVSRATKFTALMYAARCQNAELVEILARHSDSRATDEYGLSALLIAVSHGHAATVRALIPYSDLKAMDGLFGKTAADVCGERGLCGTRCVAFSCLMSEWSLEPSKSSYGKRFGNRARQRRVLRHKIYSAPRISIWHFLMRRFRFAVLLFSRRPNSRFFTRQTGENHVESRTNQHRNQHQ